MPSPQSAPPADPAPPADDVRDLFRGEHLVLLGFRAMALGHADCPRLRRTFHGLLGADVDDAMLHILALVRVVGCAGRRRVQLHPPGCCGVTADERQVLAVVAAGQSSLIQGDEAPLRVALERLLGGPTTGGLPVRRTGGECGAQPLRPGAAHA